MKKSTGGVLILAYTLSTATCSTDAMATRRSLSPSKMIQPPSSTSARSPLHFHATGGGGGRGAGDIAARTTTTGAAGVVNNPLLTTSTMHHLHPTSLSSTSWWGRGGSTTTTNSPTQLRQSTRVSGYYEQEQYDVYPAAATAATTANKYHGGGTTSSSGIGPVLMNAYQTYVTYCRDSPFLTKSLTAGVIMGLGDIIAQNIERATMMSSFGMVQYFNVVRFSAFVLTGICFNGPFLHFWYNQLAKLGTWISTKQFGNSKTIQLSAQIVADQTIGATIFYSLYFYAFDILKSLVSFQVPILAETTNKVATKFLSVLITNYYVWPFVTYINFRHIPSDLRVLVSSIVALFWNIYMCSRIAG